MQKNLKIKVLILIPLFILTFILFYIHSYTGDNSSTTSEKFYSTTGQLHRLASSKIDTILTDFGIKKAWIENQFRKDKGTTNNDIHSLTEKLWFSKKVTIPLDLSAAELFIEINSFLKSIDLSTTINEDPKTRNLSVNIHHIEDTLKRVLAKIDFFYSDKVKREAADVCIILNNLQDFSEEELNAVLNSTERYSLILPVNIEETDIQSTIFDSEKEYLLLLDIGGEDDIHADFRNNMKGKNWKSKIRTLCYEYDKAGGILLRIQSNQFKFENDVRDEFKRFRGNVFRDSVFIDFKHVHDGGNKVKALFSNIKQRASKGNRNLIYLVNFSFEDFQNYSKRVYSLKKKGYKFVTFSSSIKRRYQKDEDSDQQENIKQNKNRK